MQDPTILIDNGDEILRQDLKGLLLGQGFKVIEPPDKTAVIRFFQGNKPDLVIIVSRRNSTTDGLKVAEHIRRRDRQVPIILVTMHSSEARVIAALRAGVNDYFKVPFSKQALVASINRFLSSFSRQSRANQKAPVDSLDNDHCMIGESPAMQEIKAYLLNVAPTESTVLITGETGTGKELAAELIHRNSLRHNKPFICINCAALPESLVESEMFGYERGAFTGAETAKQGKFELADGGTVFLDEIGDMSPYAQAKILRTTENKEVYRLGGDRGMPVDIRVTAATNQDPEQLVTEGKFRKDLYYRLNVVRVHLPPLRDRKEDIPPLLEYYIQKLNRRFGRQVEGFTKETLASLFHYDWPGNVRELKNLLEATFINLPSRRIAFVDLPTAFRRCFKEAEGLPKKERDRVLSALFATNWNKSKAARKLHWSRMTIYRKMAKYHIVTSRHTSR